MQSTIDLDLANCLGSPAGGFVAMCERPKDQLTQLTQHSQHSQLIHQFRIEILVGDGLPTLPSFSNLFDLFRFNSIRRPLVCHEPISASLSVPPIRRLDRECS